MCTFFQGKSSRSAGTRNVCYLAFWDSTRYVYAPVINTCDIYLGVRRASGESYKYIIKWSFWLPCACVGILLYVSYIPWYSLTDMVRTWIVRSHSQCTSSTYLTLVSTLIDHSRFVDEAIRILGYVKLLLPRYIVFDNSMLGRAAAAADVYVIWMYVLSMSHPVYINPQGHF